MELIVMLVFTVLSLQYISSQQTQYEEGQYYTIIQLTESKLTPLEMQIPLSL